LLFVFRELCKDTATAAALRKHLGVTSQTISQFRNGTTIPKIDNLIRIADFFNVSIDFLLGRTDTASQDVNIQTVCATTGLTESVVKKLAAWTSADDWRKLWADYVSFYITSPDFEEALGHLSDANKN
jgi:transcriptional regulator with XRE-family HTH domain